MQIAIEFVGHARDIVGAAQIDMQLPDDANYHDVTARLAAAYPNLVGLFISEETGELLSSTVFINCDELITYERMAEQLRPNDRLTLLTVMVGG